MNSRKARWFAPLFALALLLPALFLAPGAAQAAAPAELYHLPGIKITSKTAGSSAHFQAVVNYAVKDIGLYWKSVFAASHLHYSPPSRVVPYTQSFKSSLCGWVPRNNALYCTGNNRLYYDPNFLRSQYNQIGDFAPVTILAHEWGHLVQADLGIDERSGRYYSITIELQADCLAGAYAAHARAEGVLDPGDLSEATTSLYGAGDPRAEPWFAPGAHGQPSERVAAFRLGLGSGPDACLR